MKLREKAYAVIEEVAPLLKKVIEELVHFLVNDEKCYRASDLTVTFMPD